VSPNLSHTDRMPAEFKNEDFYKDLHSLDDSTRVKIQTPQELEGSDGISMKRQPCQPWQSYGRSLVSLAVFVDCRDECWWTRADVQIFLPKAKCWISFMGISASWLWSSVIIRGALLVK
jgi:hypothetical protein